MKVRRALVPLLAVASLAPTLLVGCRSGGGETVAPPVATPPAADGAKTVSRASTVPTVRVLLDDPRLATARAFERAKDWPNAAKAAHEARPADLPDAEACAWDYLEGRLFTAANGPEEALAAYQRAELQACPLSGHAKLHASQALARLGRADQAIAKARSLPSDLHAASDDAKMVIAESLSAKGDRAGALPLWREWLAANPHGSRWLDTSVRIAVALLDGVDGPPDAHAREAYELATKVIVEAPKLADSSGATAARLRAVALLKPRDPSVTEALSDAERARQAQGWLDANEPQRAFDLASSVYTASKAPSVACKSALTRANAGAKKSPKVDGWNDAVTACQKEGELVTALYAGAKARASKDPRLALEWFGKVEQLFPGHRLADDARFRAALLVAQGSDEDKEERSEQMLRTLPDAYPAGDMRAEALFRAALARMQRGRAEDWEAAKPILDRILEIAPDDRHWASAGRAEYFRARAAAATGDAEGARTRYARIIEQNPLAFYMLLSYARLAADDPARAKKTLEGAITRDKGDQGGVFPSHALAPLDTPGFNRALRLLEVGDVEGARRELTVLGVFADGVDPELLWTVGAVYNQAGMPETGHSFSRGKLADHLPHYPEGKWRLPWETAYPRAFEPLVVRACAKYGLPQAITWGVMREESTFIADVKSPANAYGLMQLIVPTARGLTNGTGFGSDVESLKKPEVSIELGTRMLAGLRTSQPHIALAIGSYNGGSGSVGRWMNARTSDEVDLFVENMAFEETRNYVKRVLSSVAAYGYLYEKKTFEEALAMPLRFAR